MPAHRIIEIDLGRANNPQIDVDAAKYRVKFTNTTDVEITLTTPGGMLPSGDRNLDPGETKIRNGYRITEARGASLEYTWSNVDGAEASARSGTIRVT